jgi:wyosine [tRNA(Phe)-imidazoG37] synthetase (radical SAM superfamily)
MQLENAWIYGPVRSRRFGWDLGINLLPLNRKLCCFDCIYCQYGFTPHFLNDRYRFPSAAEIINSLESRLEVCTKNGMQLRHLTVAGNGEPTMHPDFLQIAEALAGWRKQNHPQMRLALLTAGYRCGDQRIRKAMELFDEPIVKFDSAVPHKWLAINRPRVPLSFQEFQTNLTLLSGLILQTMFIRDWNDSEEDIHIWREAIEKIKPQSVQIYTISRTPAETDLVPVDQKFLRRIESLSSTTGIPIQAFC